MIFEGVTRKPASDGARCYKVIQGVTVRTTYKIHDLSICNTVTPIIHPSRVRVIIILHIFKIGVTVLQILKNHRLISFWGVSYRNTT